MYNKSMRRSRLARTILAGTLGAVLAVTSAVTALADEIIVEDAAPATEDSGIIDASSETESAGDASGEAQTIVIEEAKQRLLLCFRCGRGRSADCGDACFRA